MKSVLPSFRPFAAFLLSVVVLPAAAQTYTLPPELWDRPRSADVVLAQPVVRDAVRGLLQQPGQRLVIHHAPGQEALLHAEELRSWLIALAVAGEAIVLQADRNRGEPLTLELKR